MDDAYREEFEAFAGDLLAELGYETTSWPGVASGLRSLPS